MNKVVGEDNTVSRSFMCLGFIAAALIVAVQWRGAAARSEATPALSASASTLSQPPLGSIPPTATSSDLAPALEGVFESALGLSEAKLIIDLSDRQVYLYKHGDLVANYEIAVGRSGWETPTGEFTVINKRIDPVWQHPFTKQIVPAGPDNPLGSRWIGFWTDGANQIGLHGTNQEDLIGQAVSHGCVRMREPDIQELFELMHINTPVLVRS
jgi:lipoprotein-anchoring transpeptidase ErfK/SrfK